MARGLISPLLGGLSFAWASIGWAAKAIATALPAKKRMEEIRRVAAQKRNSMRYFTLINKYAHNERVAQGDVSSFGLRGRFVDQHA